MPHMITARKQREYARRAFSDTIEYRVTDRFHDKIFLGAAVNISESGMCIYTFDRLAEGETIEINKRLPVACKKATVKWVKAYSGDFYKVGLRFVP